MNESANIELVKEAYGKFVSGDIEGLQNLFSDDIEWHIPAMENVGYSGSRYGKAGTLEFFTLLSEIEETTKFEPVEFIAQGNRVVNLGKYGARVKETNRSYEVDWVHIFTINDGKVSSFQEFYDTATVERAYQKSTAA